MFGELPPGATKGSFRDTLELVCLALLLMFFFKTFVGQQYTIPSGSMRNTLKIGDHLLANKFIFAVPQWAWEEALFPMRRVQRGDIIIFRYPMERNMDYVKRCVALAGDVVEIRSKRLYVNGRLVTGPWEHHTLTWLEEPQGGPWPLRRSPGLPNRGQGTAWPLQRIVPTQGETPLGRNGKPFPFRDQLGPVRVPAGCLFAMGDNRESSEDSRYWGFLPADHLRGRPFLIWWSYREGGRDDLQAKMPTHPGDVVDSLGDGLMHGLVWTRWERFGRLPR